MLSSDLPVISLPGEHQIRELVNLFYSRVRNDELLGPIFAAAIDGNWEEHLVRMTDFWSTVVLASRRYKGNPMDAHLALPRLSRNHFERWLGYWRTAASELLGDAQASIFVKKAEFMADRLLFAINAHHDPLSTGQMAEA